MKTTRLLGATAALPLLLLAGCANEPTVDLVAAQEWVDRIRAAESDGPGFAGAAAIEVGTEESSPSTVRLELSASTVLTRVDVRCYGEKDGAITATVSVTLESADGEMDAVEQSVPCDQGAHAIIVGATPSDSVLIESFARTRTYLHATVITELTVER